MNRLEYLLVCLAEECSEVAHACGKSLRFGDSSAWSDLTNAEQMWIEYHDIIAIMEMLADIGVVPSKEIDRELVHGKKERLKVFMEKSMAMGRLDG